MSAQEWLVLIIGIILLALAVLLRIRFRKTTSEWGKILFDEVPFISLLFGLLLTGIVLMMVLWIQPAQDSFIAAVHRASIAQNINARGKYDTIVTVIGPDDCTFDAEWSRNQIIASSLHPRTVLSPVVVNSICAATTMK